MTWVLATSFAAFGSMIADVRLTDTKGAAHPLGLRKVYPFSDRTVCGFSGLVVRCFEALDSVNAYMRANGEDDPPLTDQLDGWIAEVTARGDVWAAPTIDPSELLMLRVVVDEVVPVLLVGGLRVTLPYARDAEFRVQRFLGVEHIGSGSGIAAYQAAAEDVERSLPGFAGFAQAGAAGAIGQIIGNGLSETIRRSGAATISPDVDVVVLTAAPHWRASLRRTEPPLHVCQSLREFELHAGAGDSSAVIA
jgi:hypothetical protein